MERMQIASRFMVNSVFFLLSLSISTDPPIVARISISLARQSGNRQTPGENEQVFSQNQIVSKTGHGKGGPSPFLTRESKSEQERNEDGNSLWSKPTPTSQRTRRREAAV
jgi:hypothetical protein